MREKLQSICCQANNCGDDYVTELCRAARLTKPVSMYSTQSINPTLAPTLLFSLPLSRVLSPSPSMLPFLLHIIIITCFVAFDRLGLCVCVFI